MAIPCPHCGVPLFRNYMEGGYTCMEKGCRKYDSGQMDFPPCACGNLVAPRKDTDDYLCGACRLDTG